MKTISARVIRYLTERGMLEQQAQAVLEIVKGRNEAMDGLWEHAPSDYPEILIRAILLDTRKAAIEWIDANLPQAFFRPMFTNEMFDPKED